MLLSIYRRGANMTYLKAGTNYRSFITSIMSLGKTSPNVRSTATRCLQHFITYCRIYDSTFHYVVQTIRQHISRNSTNIRKIFLKTNCEVGTVRLAAYLTHFIQFRDRASLVHWNAATFIMTEAHL